VTKKQNLLTWEDERRSVPEWGWHSYSAKAEGGDYFIQPSTSLERCCDGYTAVFRFECSQTSYRAVGGLFFRSADDAKAAAQHDYAESKP
jgi:hypothetical protein